MKKILCEIKIMKLLKGFVRMNEKGVIDMFKKIIKSVLNNSKPSYKRFSSSSRKHYSKNIITMAINIISNPIKRAFLVQEAFQVVD